MLKIYCLIQYREQIFIRFDLRPTVGLWRGPLGLSLVLPLSSLWLLRASSPISAVLRTAFNWDSSSNRYSA